MKKEEILKVVEIFKFCKDKKLYVINFLLKKVDENLEIKTNYREVIKETGVAHSTVATTLKELKDNNYLIYNKKDKTYKFNL